MRTVMNKSGKWRFSIVLGFAVLISICNSTSKAQSVRWNGNISYSEGKYLFLESTGSLYINNSLSLEYKRFTISAGVPFVIQNSPWITYGTGTGLPTGGTQHGEVGRIGTGSGSNGSDGMGHGSGRRNRVDLTDTTSYRSWTFSDPYVSASMMITDRYYSRFSFMVNGQLKVPAASPSNGFGTGAWDGALGISASKRSDTGWLVFADFMYWWLGDMDELALNNALAFGAGVGKMFLGSKWMASINLNGMTAIIEGFDPPLSLSAGAGYRVNDRSSLTFNLGIGLSESSPDFTTGIGWTIRFS
jgi:hypothetical protein